MAIEYPDKDDTFNMSMPNKPLSFTMPVENKSYFAKENTMVNQWIYNYQCIQWNNMQDSRPG